MARESGSQFGPYVIHSLLGAGGMGEVYRARDGRLNRDVALKFLHADADARRFQTEARAVAALNHPNIVSIFDVADGYLVTELVDGNPLRKLKPTQREAIDYAAQIADGLAAAHSAGITHRDLKPDNVMVTREGRVKILDFGLARQAQSGTDDATRTLGGMVMGTVAYMSPEQARGQAADARSDIFSFGTTLYEMLAAKQPFTGESAAQTMAAVIEKDPPPLPETVPQGLKGIVLRCLEKEPARRFQSASDLAYALRAISGSSTSVQTPVPVKRAIPWLSTVLALALAGTLAFFLLRSAPVAVAISDLPRTPIPIEEPSPDDPAFSPDGKSILYTALVGETRQVFLRQLDSPDSQQLTNGAEDVRSPAWSPDASKFYFIQRRQEGELWEQSISGSKPQRIATNVFAYAITPDGRGVVFCTFFAAGGVLHLKISSPMGSPVRPLRNAPAEIRPKGSISNPKVRFSPDGKQLLFAYGSVLPVARLLVIPWPEESGAAREVPLRESSEERHPQSFAWLGDSRYVVAEHRVGGRYGLDFIDTRQATRKSHFSSYGRLEPSTFDAVHDRLLYKERGENWGAWSYSLADRKLSRLHDTSLNETEPAWSPDGSTLAFVTHYSEEDELWLKNVAAGWKRVLFKSSATGDKTARFRAPAFSPDGGRLAVTVILDQAIVPSGYAIYLILTKSGQATRLPGDFGTGLRPVDWSPDGRSLAFRNVAGTLQILDVESGKLRQLGWLTGNRSNTTWSRDGKWIARVDRTGVWLVSPDGKETRQVSKRIFTSADAPAHCFSADGSRLYILRNEGAFGKLEELVLATDELRTLTVLPGAIPPDNYNRGMRLHPDGKSVVFTSGEVTTTFWLVDGVTAALNR